MPSDFIVFYNAKFFLPSGKHMAVDMKIVEGLGFYCIGGATMHGYRCRGRGGGGDEWGLAFAVVSDRPETSHGGEILSYVTMKIFSYLAVSIGELVVR